MTTISLDLNELQTGIFILSSDFNFKFANNATVKLLGLSEEHLRSLSPAIASMSPAFARLLGRIAKGDFRNIKMHKSELLHLPANGQYLSVRISISQSRDYVLEINPLQAQDISKSTHELKRPIQNIKALIEALILGAKNNPAILDKYLGNILLESDRLSRLVSDMLKLNYLSRGVIEPRKQELLLAPMVNKIFETHANCGVNLKSTLSDKALLVGDPELIEHLLENLIDNAIKYNRKGGTVKVEQEQPFSISVSDTGKGIDKDEIDRLGEEFFRASGSESVPGTGLGLSLVRSIVDLHAGTLEIESKIGEGSKFTVKL